MRHKTADRHLFKSRGKTKVDEYYHIKRKPMYCISDQDINITVDDFMTFCRYLDEEKPALSARKVVLGKKDLFKINSLLKHTKNVSAPNYQQASYPVIDLMFHLVLNGGLYLKKGGSKQKVHLTATERKSEFDSLNAYEKYAFLLETFWIWQDLEDFLRFELSFMDQIVQTIGKSSPGKKLKRELSRIEKTMIPSFPTLR